MPTQYYKDRIEAFHIIDLMVSGNKPRDEIILKIERETGFSAKFVNNYLNRMIKSGYIGEYKETGEFYVIKAPGKDENFSIKDDLTDDEAEENG